MVVAPQLRKPQELKARPSYIFLLAITPINTTTKVTNQCTSPRLKQTPSRKQQITSSRKNLKSKAHSLQFQRLHLALITSSSPLRLNKERRKTTADKNNKIDKIIMALPWLPESIQPSRVRPIKEKIMIETKIIWAEQFVT